MKERIQLEPLAQKVCLENKNSPFLFELPIEEGREKLEKMQNSEVQKYPAKIENIVLNINKLGNVKVYIVSPLQPSKKSNVIFYIHGAGWVFGSFHTHEKLVRELSARTNSIIIFPEYTRANEAKFPVAIEQCYYVMCQIPNILQKSNPSANIEKLSVAGDSVGGNMAIAMTLLSKFRNGPKIEKQLLYYPVTNDNFNTLSYNEFAEGYYLYRKEMKWFWDQYAPNPNLRNYIVATPLKSSLEQLRGLPKALIINGEADILRDEGEAYAEKLMAAGIDVTAIRIKGTIHDFVMLNELDQSNACRAAMDISTAWFNRK